MKIIFRYSALILGLILGFFFLVMSLDSVPQTASREEILGFLINMLPGLIVLLASLLALKLPKAGFIVFLMLTVSCTIFFHTYKDIQTFMIVSFPLLLITLMLLSAFKKPFKD